MKLFCKHEWEMIEDTCHIYDGGSSKGAIFKCPKCGKESWFDIFRVPKHKHVFKVENKGQISDGSHTFQELYYHRMILFALICNTYNDKSWKSWKHADGSMYENYFIVGIDTPAGQYSYHYHKKYWDKFKYVNELEFAPEWDGHKPEDVDRLLSLYFDNIKI